jgi:hypothetical protein
VKTIAASTAKFAWLNGARAVLALFVAASAVFFTSLQLYEDSFSITPAVFFVAAMLAAYFTGIIWLAGTTSRQDLSAGLTGRTRNSGWRWLAVVSLLFTSVLTGASYTGILSMARVITADRDVHSVSLSGTVLHRWDSDAAGAITPVSGNSYQIKIHAPLLLTSMQDNFFITTRFSDMEILEGGVRLPTPHAPHADIATIGAGRYSHFGHFFTRNSLVYFSATDNTTPMDNGRTIELRYRLILNPVFIILLLTLAGIMLSGSHSFLGSVSAIGVLYKTSPYRQLVNTGIAVFTLLVFIFPLLHTWQHAINTYTAIVGYLPWSDASGWQFSAEKLLHTGELFDWSERRPLNPAIRAMINMLVGERLNWTLLCYALFSAVGAAYAARNLQKSYGLIAGLIAMGVIAYFANEFLPVTMSESLGFILGITGFAFMWRSIEARSPIIFSLGLAIFTAGMTARPGPVSVLPMLVIWAALARMDGRKFSPKWLMYAVLGLGIGFMPGTLFGKIYGTGANLPGSNFSYTLYGLALGGESWHRGYEVPAGDALTETERTNVVYVAALEQIRKDPAGLLRGGTKFLINYFTWFHVYIENKVSKQLGLLLILTGVVISLFRLKNGHCSFLLAGGTGILASAPLIFWDYDAYRAYIVTVGFDAGMAALGANYLIQQFRPGLTIRPEPDMPISTVTSSRRAIVTCCAILLVLFIGPILAISTYQQPVITDAGICQAGEKSAVLHIGRSSPYIHVVESGANTFIPQIAVDITAQVEDIHDFGLDRYLRELQPGEIMIWGYNILEPGVDKGMYIAKKDLLPVDGAYYQTCGHAINLESSGTYTIVKVVEARQVYP